MAANLAPPTRESFTPLSRPRKVDMEKGVAEDLCILGPDSRNGGTYPEDVIRKYVGLYEGCPCYVDIGGVHARNVMDDPPATSKFGLWRNVRVAEGRLRGDLHFNPEHEFAKPFRWAAENRPELYGVSPVHRVGKKFAADGSWAAESISRVFSADIVSEAATTSTLHESKDRTMDPATPPDPRMIGAGLTTPDALSQFLTAMLDALPSGTFSDAEKASVLSQIMAKYEGAAGGSDVTSTAAMESLSRRGPVGKAAAAFIGEVVTERKRADRLKRAKDLCQSKGLPVHLASDVFVDTVAESIDNAPRAEALIADRLASGKPATPADTTRKDPYTPPPGQGVLSVEDLVKQAVAGI